MKIERLVLGGLQTNCYILYDEVTKECAVFDPAADSGRIILNIKAKGLHVKYIILTHSHIDHIMALDDLKEETRAKIVIHRDEAEFLNNSMVNLACMFGVNSPNSKADVTVNDGDTFLLGDKKLKIIHTPGHTVGGMCILCDNILISGDTLFYESVGRSDFPGGSATVLAQSVRQKIMCLEDYIEVYPGHGPSTTIGAERRSNPFIQ